MNKIYTLIALIVMSASAFAQSYDVGISAIAAPTAGDTVYANTPTDLGYTRTNFGDTLKGLQIVGGALSGDYIVMDVSANNSAFVELGYSARISATDFAPGANEARTGSPFDWGAMATQLSLNAGDAFDFCISTRIVSTDSTSTASDTLATNDSTCINLIFGGTVVLDYGVTALALDSPMVATDTIEPGVLTGNFTMTLNYNGSQTYNTNGTDVPLGITIDGAAATGNVIYTLTAPSAPGFSVNLNLPASLLSANFPTTPGPFRVCAFSSFGTDPDATNDSSCIMLVVRDTATPVDTTGGGGGGGGGGVFVATEASPSANVFVDASKNLNVELPAEFGTSHMSVISTNGTVVLRSEETTEVIRKNISELSTGQYIVIINNDKGQSINEKVFVR